LPTYFTAIAGNDPFTTEAALASVSEGDDTPFQMPLPEMRKTRTAVKAEDSVKFEDMCEVIGSVSVVLAYLFHRDMQALIPHNRGSFGFPVKETIAHATVCNAEGHEATSGYEVRRYG